MQTIRLTRGLGEEGKKHCVMAATSIVAEEEFTDKPKCVCPTITAALIELNDSYGDDDVAREEALGHLPWIIIGTRGDRNHERERAFLFADWAVRECCGIECEPITDRETALDARAAAAVDARATRATRAAAAANAAATYAAAAAATYAAAAAATYAAAAARAAARADAVRAAAVRADAADARAAARADAVRAAAVRAAAARADAARADAARAAARVAKHANRRQDLITYIESIIIPVYTTMPIEPGFRNECLILA